MFHCAERESTSEANVSNIRGFIVLGAATWAFVVCFAVWLMFGVIGIPIRDELGLN